MVIQMKTNDNYMTTVYKQGSRGEEVRKIQQALIAAGYKMYPDGVYGPKTAEAVKMFQQKAGLRPVDGIVGPATMARLFPKPKDDLGIIDGHIDVHVTRQAGRPIKYIAIHYTAGGNSRRGQALATRSVFLRRSASADFVVDDEQIVRINPDIRNCYCWAVGDRKNPYSGGGSLYGVATNRNTISIEVCSTLQSGTSAAVPNHAGWSFTDKVLDNTLRLVRYLMREYGIPKENVIRHYDVSGKPCPGIPGWNDAVLYTTAGEQTREKSDSTKWLAFKQRI